MAGLVDVSRLSVIGVGLRVLPPPFEVPLDVFIPVSPLVSRFHTGVLERAMRMGAGLLPSRVVDELAGAVRMRLPVSLSSSLSSRKPVLGGAVDVPSHLRHPGRSLRLNGRLQSSHLPGGAGAASPATVGYMVSW